MKNLIYCTIAYNPSFINLAKLCVESLRRTGYQGDLLFLTEFDFKFEFDNIIYQKIKTNNLFLADKLRINEFFNINEYDKFIYSDVDLLWLKNPQDLFDTIDDKQFSFSQEAPYLMSDEWWGNKLVTEEERVHIKNNNIYGLNSGIFGFDKSALPIFPQITDFLNANLDKLNACLEQPILNVFLYRNNLYNNNFNEYVSHQGYSSDVCKKHILHFAGGPGNFSMKYEKMSNFWNTVKNKKPPTRKIFL